MSASKNAASSRSPKAKASGDDPKPPIQFLPPLKPRPRLAIALGILLILWLIVLVVLRLTTVHR